MIIIIIIIMIDVAIPVDDRVKDKEFEEVGKYQLLSRMKLQRSGACEKSL